MTNEQRLWLQGEYTAEPRGMLTAGVIIDDKMYNLDDAEHVLVEEDLD